MLVLIIRTLILYGAVVFSMRIMGKRQMGELQPSELVVAIMISDLASVPMQAIDIPLLSGIVPVLTLIVAEVCLSFFSAKYKTARKILSGKPSILIYNGRINISELRRLRFSINDLLEELRTAGSHNILDIEVAVLETNGKLSIIEKSGARSVTVRDLNLKDAADDGLPFIIVSEGSFNKQELKRACMSEEEAIKLLEKNGIKNVSDVFLASLDVSGNLYLQSK